MRGGGGDQIKRFVSHSCRSRRLRWLQIKFSYDALTGVDRKTSGRVAEWEDWPALESGNGIIDDNLWCFLWPCKLVFLQKGEIVFFYSNRFLTVFSRILFMRLAVLSLVSSTTGTDFWSCYCADNTATTGWWPRKSCPLLIPSAWVVAE